MSQQLDQQRVAVDWQYLSALFKDVETQSYWDNKGNGTSCPGLGMNPGPLELKASTLYQCHQRGRNQHTHTMICWTLTLLHCPLPDRASFQHHSQHHQVLTKQLLQQWLGALAVYSTPPFGGCQNIHSQTETLLAPGAPCTGVAMTTLAGHLSWMQEVPSLNRSPAAVSLFACKFTADTLARYFSILGVEKTRQKRGPGDLKGWWRGWISCLFGVCVCVCGEPTHFSE